MTKNNEKMLCDDIEELDTDAFKDVAGGVSASAAVREQFKVIQEREDKLKEMNELIKEEMH